MDCLFCKIAAGEIPCQKVYEDDKIIAFYDIEPQAPVHLLLVPKQHLAGADEITVQNAAIIAHIFTVIPALAKELGLTGGYRIVNNCGADAQQSVSHIHFHLLGGRLLGWPPG